MADLKTEGLGFSRRASSEATRHSCALCYQRKVKCDKRSPCGNCVSRHVACKPMERHLSRPRKKRFPEAELLARLRRYEAVLKSYGVDIDRINDPASEIGPAKTAAEAPSPVHPDPRHERSQQADQPKAQHRIQPPRWPRNTNDIEGTERLLVGSSESQDGSAQRPIFTTYDHVFPADGSTLIFDVRMGDSVDLTSLHPETTQILQLWQIYLDNVHPLLKCIHAPTIQQWLFKHVGDLPSIQPSWHALMFAIYSVAVVSSKDGTLPDNRYSLTSRYQTAARYALQKSQFLRSTDPTLLAAFVLYLVSLTKTTDPRSLLSLTAIAERNARRNDYHLNSDNQASSQFDVEMRKRLWWQIVVLQSRAAETAAAGPSALSWDWSTPLPLNINEGDLDPKIQTRLIEHNSPTDMTFCLVRYEIANFLRTVWVKTQAQAPGSSRSEFSSLSISLAEKLRTIENFENLLQHKYLRSCDPNIPLQAMAQYYATYSITRMKIIAYATALHSEPGPGSQTVLQVQDALMLVCLEAIEAYIVCFTNKAVEKFIWFLTSSVPFLAYVHLLFRLKASPSMKLADRAWAAITKETDICGRPRWIWGLSPSRYEPEDSAMQLAFANLTVKAWEAREGAFKGDGILETPTLVTKMREKKAKAECQENATNGSHHETANMQVTQPPLPSRPMDEAAIAAMQQFGGLGLYFPTQDTGLSGGSSMTGDWTTAIPEYSFEYDMGNFG